ncbi:MAG: hypothetical protein IJ297_06445, partial [Clostridia bacterium]|nr:hypothetical protein [Clostridia bacterium]
YQLRHTSLLYLFLWQHASRAPTAVNCTRSDFAFGSSITDSFRIGVVRLTAFRTPPHAPHLGIVSFIDYILLKLKKQVYFLSTFKDSRNKPAVFGFN